MQTTKDKWTKKRKVLLKKVSGYAEPRYTYKPCFAVMYHGGKSLSLS